MREMRYLGQDVRGMLFEDGDAMARLSERPCGGETCDAGADDDKVENVLRARRNGSRSDMHEEREDVWALFCGAR